MKRNIKLLVITVLLTLLTVTGCGKNNSSNDNNSVTNSGNVKYVDASRNIKETYTFSNALSKFAIKFKDSTIIFSTNGENSLDNYTVGGRITFKFNNGKAYFNTVALYEYGKNSLEDFKKEINEDTLGNNVDFKDILKVYSDNTKHKDIKIIDENDEYVFISRTSEDGKNIEYLFGQKVGEYVYFTIKTYTATSNLDEKGIDDLMDSNIALFICLTEDDTKTPYLVDMIANVPIVGNKKIVDPKGIYGVGGSGERSEGFIIFLGKLAGSGQFEIYYGAKKMYDVTRWSKDIDSNTKYYSAPAQILFGVNDKDNYQIFSQKFFSSNSINSLDDFFDSIKDYVK